MNSVSTLYFTLGILYLTVIKNRQIKNMVNLKIMNWKYSKQIKHATQCQQNMLQTFLQVFFLLWYGNQRNHASFLLFVLFIDVYSSYWTVNPTRTGNIHVTYTTPLGEYFFFQLNNQNSRGIIAIKSHQAKGQTKPPAKMPRDTMGKPRRVLVATAVVVTRTWIV